MVSRKAGYGTTRRASLRPQNEGAATFPPLMLHVLRCGAPITADLVLQSQRQGGSEESAGEGLATSSS